MVEGSKLYSKLLPLKYAKKAVRSLRLKLRYFGISMVSGHETNMYCNNQTVLNNNKLLLLNLNNNIISVEYYSVQYAVALKIITITRVNKN